MQAYTCGITKEQFVNEIKAHQEADNFIKGTYSDGEKGCAVGCSLKSIAKLKGIDLHFSDHKKYEEHLGIPAWLARVEDTIFEGLSTARSKSWPLEFSCAINTGSDLNQIIALFIIFLLESNIQNLSSLAQTGVDCIDSAVLESIKANQMMLEAHKYKDEKMLSEARLAAESAAWSARSAAWSARSAAWSAARSAMLAAESAESAAWSARSAESAADSAESAADSAESAADSARSAAESARSAAESARSAAESASYEKFADELLRLIKECHG
jgi:hypothetical protein